MTQEPSDRPLRLYVLDGGSLERMDPRRFGLELDETSTDRLSVTAYLVVHPNGTLMWDTGAVPDRDWSPGGQRVEHRLRLPDGSERVVSLARRVGRQLDEIGVDPTRVTHLALSHHHYDHTANAGLFTNATWLVRRPELEVMRATPPPALTRPADFGALLDGPIQLIDAPMHDVFGDGMVVLISAPGHTPGHQVLLVWLAETGPILLSGDLYHYPQERTLDRIPTFEADPVATRASRRTIEAVLAETGAALWIGHDAVATATRRMAPAFYA